MKIKLFAIAAILTLGVSGSAIAATSTGWADQSGGAIAFGGAVPGPVITFKPSANVHMAYDSQTTGVSYTVGSYHEAGTKIYGTGSVDARIYMQDIPTPGAVKPTPVIPTDSATAYFGTGWTALK